MNKGGLYPTSNKLENETASMAANLAELRKAMEKERAKREALIANRNAAPIWRSAKPSNSARNKAAAGSNVKDAQPQAQKVPAPKPASPQAPIQVAGSAQAIRTPDQPTRSRVADRLIVQHEPEVPGMSCGADEGGLAGGGFNEGDSHRSFLEALNEWRRGNRGEEEEPASDPPPTPGAAAGMQTEAARPRSSGSASRASYFDKLFMSSASRNAGLVAHLEVAEERPPSSSGRPLPERINGPTPSTPPRPPAAHLEAGSRASIQLVIEKVEDHEFQSWPRALDEGELGPKLAALRRLEELELKADQAAAAEDALLASENSPEPVVSSLTGVVGLTRGTRLPDNILLPDE